MLSAYFSSLTSYHVTSEKLSPNLRDKNNYVVPSTLSKARAQTGSSNFKIQTECLDKALHRLQYREDTSRKIVILTVSLKKSQQYAFGKTMESLRKGMNLELVTNPTRTKKLIARPTTLHWDIITENLVWIRNRNRNHC